MNVYFAAPRKGELRLLREEGATHILLSFADEDFGLIDAALGMGFRVLLDSGAYSAFSRGASIDIEDYAAALRQYRGAVDAYVSLDVCDNPAKTRDNYWWLKDRGFAPMPVWHFGEPETVLGEILDCGAEYVGLGGSVLAKYRPQARFRQWVKETTRRYPEVRFHGFAVGILVAEHACLWSADSTTWLAGAQYGQQIGRRGVARTERYGLFWTRKELVRHNIRALLWQAQHLRPTVPDSAQLDLFEAGGDVR